MKIFAKTVQTERKGRSISFSSLSSWEHRYSRLDDGWLYKSFVFTTVGRHYFSISTSGIFISKLK